MEDNCYSVYVHINKINNKKYVGMTSRKPEKRWGHNGINYQRQLFYRAIQKYGWENFEHKIIATNLTLTDASELEKSLIKKYNSLINQNGYNVDTGGSDGSHGFRPIYQFDLSGNYIQSFDSLIEAEKLYGIPVPNIIGCCQGRYAQTGGYIWRYQDEIADLVNFKESLDNRKYERYEPVYKFDLDGNFIEEYQNAQEASKSNPNCLSCSILNNCRGEYKQSQGYIWKFKKDVPDIIKFKETISEDYFLMKKPETEHILMFDLNGLFIKEFESTTKASEYIHCTPQMVSKVCCGSYPKVKNYILRYKSEYNGEPLSYIKPEREYKHVLQFNLDDGSFIREYSSTNEIVQEFGFNRCCIRDACLGKQKSAYGFKWEYKKDKVS